MAEATATLANPLAVFDTIPGFRQLALLVGLALSIALGVTAAFWFAEPSYSLLFSNVSDREAGEIIDVLSGSEIPHQVDRNSGAILVADDRLHDARLKLAGQGLPRGTGFGLEIIDGENGFSTSQFMENARYHHAIETELARTIGNLRPIQYARVHIAETKSTVFLRKKQQPSASVFVYLYPGRLLEKPQVMAIIHLVASSIPSMESSQVTVVDQNGQLLNSPGDNSEFDRSSKQMEQVRQIEETYVGRIQALLTPMLGPNRVRATVTARLDFTTREETKEQYDRENAAVRSEQVAENRVVDSGAGAAAGVAGALSNQPPSTAAQTADANAENADGTPKAKPVNESIERIRNFEIDRTLSHTRQPTGAITRLSVAVLVDDKQSLDEDGDITTAPLTGDELENLERLVKDAVGFDEARGDRVSVSNVAFFNEPDPEPVEEPGFMESMGSSGLVKQLLSAALVLAIVFGVVRPFLRNFSGVFNSAPVVAGRGGNAALAAAQPANAPPARPLAESLSFDEKVNVARQAAGQDPERVAAIVRGWVQTDG